MTGTASTACSWLLEWNGERRIGRDVESFKASYTAPQVSRPTRLAVQATCFYETPVTPSSPGTSLSNGEQLALARSRSTVMVRVPPSWRDTVVVTVLPPGVVSPPTSPGGSGHSGGGLPGTGGPAVWLLLAGIGALLLGSETARRSRIRPPRALPAP